MKCDWKDPADRREYLRTRWYEARDLFVACFDCTCQNCKTKKKSSRSLVILPGRGLKFKKILGLTLICRSCAYKYFPANMGNGSSRTMLRNNIDGLRHLAAQHSPVELSRQSVELLPE